MEHLWTFLIGGSICVIGQLLIDGTKLTAPRVLVLFVSIGALLTGFGLYQPLVKLAGTGATVPLPGFGYALVKGAIDAAKKKGIMGALTGGIKNTAAGIAAAIVFGYIVALIFNPKSIR
ncbi:MAG TPA: stage V sporulation protein AE [Anaerovoracaceae bacterium]|nr:stage V sporulation protein AE [Anaerovoracaceae bacterium]